MKRIIVGAALALAMGLPTALGIWSGRWVSFHYAPFLGALVMIAGLAIGVVASVRLCPMEEIR